MNGAIPIKIGIYGSYGGLNLGDEAILQSIVFQLRNTVPCEITVFTRSCGDTLFRHKVDKVVPNRSLARTEIIPEIERLDILVVGGGGIIYDADAKVYLREAQIAVEREIPVMIYSIGAGPLKDPPVQEYVSYVLKHVDAITVRDRHSQQILENAGIDREITVTADPALLLSSEPITSKILKNEGILGKKRLIGMSVREVGVAAPDIKESHYHSLLANAADYMIERYNANILFIPMEPRTFDMQHCHAVISRMLRPQRTSVLQGAYTSGQVLSIIGKLDFAVGMRLHFLIFAALKGIPFVALPYSPKVIGFLDEMHIEMPPISSVNEGSLIAYIDKFWDQKKQLQAQIRKTIPELQKRARQNNAILMNILKKPQ